MLAADSHELKLKSKIASTIIILLLQLQKTVQCHLRRLYKFYFLRNLYIPKKQNHTLCVVQQHTLAHPQALLFNCTHTHAVVCSHLRTHTHAHAYSCAHTHTRTSASKVCAGRAGTDKNPSGVAEQNVLKILSFGNFFF